MKRPAAIESVKLGPGEVKPVRIHITMSNAAFKARHGKDNPNIALIQSLKKAGVEFHVCGQGLLSRKIDKSQVLPEIDVDLWALVSIVNFEMRGYARIGGGN